MTSIRKLVFLNLLANKVSYSSKSYLEVGRHRWPTQYILKSISVKAHNRIWNALAPIEPDMTFN